MATLVLSDSQKCQLSVNPVDAHGHPAQIDGEAVFSSSDESIAKFQDDNGVQKLFAVGPGTCQVSANADADLGAGVTPITGVMDIQVTAGPAVALNVVAGTIEEQ